MESQKIAISVAEAAQRVSVCSKTVFNLIRRGELPARKIGARTVILVSDLERFLETRRKAGAVR